jgi:hypothetical protein
MGDGEFLKAADQGKKAMPENVLGALISDGVTNMMDSRKDFDLRQEGTWF